MLAHDETEENMAEEVITMEPIRVEDIPSSNGLRPSIYEPLVVSFLHQGIDAVELNLHGRTAKVVAGSVAKAARKHGAKALTRGDRVFLVRMPDTTVTEVQSNGNGAAA
jgi:hypothetical protein